MTVQYFFANGLHKARVFFKGIVHQLEATDRQKLHVEVNLCLEQLRER